MWWESNTSAWSGYRWYWVCICCLDVLFDREELFTEQMIGQRFTFNVLIPPNCGALVLMAVKLPRNLWFMPYDKNHKSIKTKLTDIVEIPKKHFQRQKNYKRSQKRIKKHKAAKHTEGEFLKPLTAWNIPPPMAPMVKAPPQSSTILQGLKEEDQG